MNIKSQRQMHEFSLCMSEIVSELRNPLLQNLCVLDAKISSGKYHAQIFLLDDDFADATKKEILKALKIATPFIKAQILTKLNWFKSPDLTFSFDATHQNATKLEQILKELNHDPTKSAK
ncbi:MAG: 30S ribosome-binding factor RbfA [Helicobacter sp.]|nr:30S ribosome-binding factor RbfA [Helicobacter sp.]